MVLNITVKTLDSQNYQFEADEDWTVQRFKEHIESTVNVSSNEQRLIFCGRVLQDDKKLTEYDCSGKVIHLVRRPPPALANPDQNSSNADSNNNNYRDAPRDNNRFLDESNVLLGAMTLGTEVNLNPILRHFLAIHQAFNSRFRVDGNTSAATSIEPLSMTDIDRHLHNAARLLRITVTTINECMARIAALPSTGLRSGSEVDLDIARRVITTASSHTDLQRDDETQTSRGSSANQSSNAPGETVDDIGLGAPTQSHSRREIRNSTTRQSLTTDDLPPPANRTIQRLAPVAVRSRNGDGPPLSLRQRGESELDRYLSILNYTCDLQNQFQGLARRYRQLTDMSRRGGLIIPQASASTSTEPEPITPPARDQPPVNSTQNSQTSSSLINEARILGMYIPRIMHHISHLQHALSDFSVDFTRGTLLLCVATNARNGQRSTGRADASTQNPSAAQAPSQESSSTNRTAAPNVQSNLSQRNQSRDLPQSNPILEGTVTITGTTIEAGPSISSNPQANATIVVTSEPGLHIPVSIPLSLGTHGSISMDFVTAPDPTRRTTGNSPNINTQQRTSQPGTQATQQNTAPNSNQPVFRPVGTIISGRIPIPFDYYLPCFSPWANYTVTNRPVGRRVVRDAFARWRASRDTNPSSSDNTSSDTPTNNNNNNVPTGPAQASADPSASPSLDMGLTEVVSNIVGSIFRMPQQSMQPTGTPASNTNQEPLLNIIPELALNAASQILGGVLGIPTNNQTSGTSQSQSSPRPQQSSTSTSATVMMDIDIDDSSSSQSESRYQDARDSQSPSTSASQSSARPTANSSRAFIPQPTRPQGSSSSDMSSRYNRQQLVEVMQSHPDWIPIIEADIGVMEQQQVANSNGQPFFSDAYLSSIPRKRRRLLASNSDQVLILQPSPSQAISNLLRRAISSSSSHNTESLDQVLGTISGDPNLQDAYEDYIKTAVEARLRSDYDYCPQKFENSSKYFK